VKDDLLRRLRNAQNVAGRARCCTPDRVSTSDDTCLAMNSASAGKYHEQHALGMSTTPLTWPSMGAATGEPATRLGACRQTRRQDGCAGSQILSVA
jgi:hypothetical protein